ncbi:hypothetical protein WICMUC_001863 [Wickerhamomyces mucosus]|uniref:Uncharacterized protein n=1 Tax=Wickerhamomyces mucosus TaxID=1378264 RepID=A0A9P8PRR1_9ASCO|nr:hypothetical protein WICMUC_001863 [Wickerhamomyces mucosus]
MSVLYDSSSSVNNFHTVRLKNEFSSPDIINYQIEEREFILEYLINSCISTIHRNFNNSIKEKDISSIGSFIKSLGLDFDGFKKLIVIAVNFFSCFRDIHHQNISLKLVLLFITNKFVKELGVSMDNYDSFFMDFINLNMRELDDQVVLLDQKFRNLIQKNFEVV